MKRAEHDIDERHTYHQQQRIDGPRADQLREHRGGANQREELRVHDRAHADEEQLRGRADRVLERIDKSGPTQLPPRDTDQDRKYCASSAALGRRHNSPIEPAYHASDEDDDRPNLCKRCPSFAPKRRTILHDERRPERWIEPATADDHDHVEYSRQNSGHDARNQQFRDGHFRKNSVNNEGNARWNQRVQRSAAGAYPRRESLVVFLLHHFRHGESRHHGSGGDTGAGCRAKSGAGPIRRNREPAGHPAKPRQRSTE